MADLSALYQQLTSAFNQGNWPVALQIAKQLLPHTPNDAGVFYVAGISNMETRRMTAAIACLNKAESLAPKRVHYVVQLARAYATVNRHREAKEVADRALALAPTDALTLDTLGVVYAQVGSYLPAAEVFGKAVDLMPDRASFRYNLATSLVAAGKVDEAEVQLDACLALDPHYFRAHVTLASLRRQTRESNHIQRLTELLESVHAEPSQPIGQDHAAELTFLNMALAKEYEDLDDYPHAMKHLVEGKSWGGADRGYSIESDAAIFKAIEDSFSPASAAMGEGYATREPIFVIGMPRTGTTLVDRIISSHPQVESAGELVNFGMSIKTLSGTRSSSMIDVDTIVQAREADWRKLGEMYLMSTRPATGRLPHFVDKLPHNFLYAGFIAHALPDAKIICLRRNPMDTCLSNFRQLFARISPHFGYSFDLLDTGRYYVLFDRLMQHWKSVLPGRILEVRYEDVVDHQRESSRRIIDFCNLPWDDACLRFEDNPTPVATASAVQVRAPIYRSALQRWKKYGAQLAPLQELLTANGIDVDA